MSNLRELPSGKGLEYAPVNNCTIILIYFAILNEVSLTFLLKTIGIYYEGHLVLNDRVQ